MQNLVLKTIAAVGVRLVAANQKVDFADFGDVPNEFFQ
jgi:hypothetical protein